jgi:acyl-CoA synthetase (AMP-forming)/AMP-acid ligase II
VTPTTGGPDEAVDLIEVTTLGDLILRAAERYQERRAVCLEGNWVSYSELAALSLDTARALAGLGVGRGDHVGVLMPNSLEFVTTMFGAALLGAVVVPINTRYRRAELQHVIRTADIHTLVTSADPSGQVDLPARLLEAFPDLVAGSAGVAGAPMLRNTIALGERRVGGMLSADDLRERAAGVPLEQVHRLRAAVSVRDAALIPFTSGTTAHPKGCVLSHEAVVRNWIAAGRRLAITADDVLWDPCPLFHAAGWGPIIFSAYYGASWVGSAHYEPSSALRAIMAERATFLYSCYPAITMALLGHPDFTSADLSAVRGMLNVAPAGILEVMQAQLPGAVQVSGYGMTEGSGILSFNDVDEPLALRLATVGRPFPGIEFRISDPESGRQLPPGRAGEIQYRGFATFDGYYNDPNATAATKSPDGWVRSGDLGSLDDEGRLSFEGRLKEMLKIGGENVSPAEIESHLAGHPAVKLVQVVGLPDEKYGEVVVAFVETHEGVSMTAEEVVAHCVGHLASFKVPRVVRFVDEWPMSATKIQKSRLIELITQGAVPTG